MGYADIAMCMAQLHLSEGNEDDASDIALLHECDDAVSVQFEARAGYDTTLSPIWGEDVEAEPTLRTIDGSSVATDILELPIPVRSIESIAIVGESPETIDSDQWILWNVDTRGNALTVRRIDGYGWPLRDGRTRVTVTAVWSDGAIGGAPPDIVISACTFITVDEYLMRKTSPSGQIGPEGFTLRPRNPWNFDLVKTAIEAVKAPLPMLVF